MEIFYSGNISGQQVVLGREESQHLVRVLRHREGDEINVMDGRGTMYVCRLTKASPEESRAVILSTQKSWGSHPYHLTMAVCPTKNNDRFEWFAEKAAELGVDEIVPVIGERSERKVFKTERLRKILLSASKQSLKAAVPEVSEPVTVSEFIASSPDDALKLIAYCFEGESPRISMKEALESGTNDRIIVMIGPEGDFSPAEALLAVKAGFVPIHLGPSRLRTETAAITAVELTYFRYCL